MKKNQISLGKILGIPIGLDYSWFLIFILITWILAVSYFPNEFKGWSQVQYWSISVFTSILFFISVILHELGHSFIALRYKIKVKEITLFLFGGISNIAQEPSKASAEFWIAIAGPIVSFLLALIFELLSIAFKHIVQVEALFEYLALINFVLAIFNLIPGFPLDGGRILRSIIWGASKNLDKATSIAATTGRIFGFLFILFGVFQILTGNLVNGMWIAFIGWFLESAASSQLQQGHMHQILSSRKVYEAMTSDFGLISEGTTLQEVLDNHFLGIGRRSLLVKKNDEIEGLLTLHRIKGFPRDKWETTDVTEAMIPNSNLIKASSNDNLWDIIQKMDTDGVNQVPVFDDGKVIGILSRDSLITFMKNLHDMGY